MSTIGSKEEAVAVARGVIDRQQKMIALHAKLKEEDMVGLECGETVQIERLSAENAGAAISLAEWIVKEHGR